MTDRPIIGFDVNSNGDAVITVAVQRDGSYKVHADKVCKALAAELLRGIADQLADQHGPFPCKPQPARQRPREDEPAEPYAGSLDRSREVWRDARGESFDLSLSWSDEYARVWRWHGKTGQFGEPVLQTEAGNGESMPLSLVRVLYGPLAPVLGGAA
ncbi:phiSA1p31-related protein [Streptomyces sp. NBC_01373]|uniref:phiSA1p31-related protein n=1 Tax=Streptomyces sp. NBC_01373 TaxID=2903843 RepID=UPI00225B6180|nr:phiSA1p31-related protein [Streptomyces sp. NBC_01373]MCX4705685.1 phiSA1p31-related protein [Streptomyces sp. NBC_01373]